MQLTSPFVVAHRAGNDRARLRAAEARGVPMIEADVHLFRGRVDVRHGRRLGALPVVVDGRRVEPVRTPFTLHDLLGEAAPGTTLLLDLKGRDPRLSSRVLDVIGPYLAERRIAVCARAWHLLEPFRAEPRVRTLPSIGSTRELHSFLSTFRRTRVAGVSVRASLVDSETVRLLRRYAEVILCWTVNCERRAAELAALGVHGFTTDVFDELGSVVHRGELLLAA